MSNNNSLQGNVFVKPEDQRELARFGLGEKTKAKSTFSLSQKTKESSLALAWRENEGKANVFVKPEDQRELARFGLARKRRQSQRYYDYMTSTF